jgi:hypothetical protein
VSLRTSIQVDESENFGPWRLRMTPRIKGSRDQGIKGSRIFPGLPSPFIRPERICEDADPKKSSAKRAKRTMADSAVFPVYTYR